MDVAKIIDETIEKSYSQFCRIMRNEGYLKDIKENVISSTTNDNNKIFQFGLRYFFNVILRINRKSQDKTIHLYIERFKQIINIYMEKDLNKAKFILEEFTDSKIIDEFLIYCPKENYLKDITEIIIDSFKLIYNDEKVDSNDNTFYYKFLNSLFTYIAHNIRQINLDNINSVLYKIINIINREFLIYMKRKNLSIWIWSFYKKLNEIDINEVINETNLPTIHSNHSILKDFSINPEENNENLRKMQGEEIDIYDQQQYIRLHDFRPNQCLIEELKKLL
jgi:ribosomal protein S8